MCDWRSIPSIVSMGERSDSRCPTVLLSHALPDGTGHVDWMIARDAAATQKLITFRLPRRLDELAPGQFMSIEHIGDHRPDFLRYEGPVSGDRGHVTHLLTGEIIQPAAISLENLQSIEIVIRWTENQGVMRDQRLRLRRTDGPDSWAIDCL